jgi:hypothetical protein
VYRRPIYINFTVTQRDGPIRTQNGHVTALILSVSPAKSFKEFQLKFDMKGPWLSIKYFY